MTENERFEIVNSMLIPDAFVIQDKYKQFTFPAIEHHKEFLHPYKRALNTLNSEKEQLREYFDIPVTDDGDSMTILELLKAYEKLKEENIHLKNRLLLFPLVGDIDG